LAKAQVAELVDAL